jgi:hypothetical protein
LPKDPAICRAHEWAWYLPHPDAAPYGHPPHERVVSAPDLIGQFFNIAARQLRIDTGAASVLQLNLDSV